MIRCANPRKEKRIHKKVGKRNMSMTLISIMNQNILNSQFNIIFNCSSFSATNGQAVTSFLAMLGVCWEDARKETGRHMVMQFRIQPDSQRNKQNEHFQTQNEMILAE